jgi:hypothetical protein
MFSEKTYCPPWTFQGNKVNSRFIEFSEVLADILYSNPAMVTFRIKKNKEQLPAFRKIVRGKHGFINP